jgi:hypothetical protein
MNVLQQFDLLLLSHKAAAWKKSGCSNKTQAVGPHKRIVRGPNHTVGLDNALYPSHASPFSPSNSEIKIWALKIVMSEI